ncbi:hypothetical protein, partial [Legionella sp.]
MRVISNFILEQLKENPDVIKIPAEQFGTASLLSYFGDLLPFASLAYEVGNVLLSQNHFQKCSLQKHSHSLATYLTEAFSLTSQQAIRITEQLIGKIVHHRGLLDETILHKSFEEVDTKTLLAISNKWLRETNMASINWEKMAYVVITNGVA